MARVKRPFRTVAYYGSTATGEPGTFTTFRAALRQAANDAKHVGASEVTKIISISPWRRKVLAHCKKTGRHIEPTNPRYGHMVNLFNAQCTLTAEGRKMLAASKRRKRRR